MADSEYDSMDDEDLMGRVVKSRRECNLDWNSDWDSLDGQRLRPSWELYPKSDDDGDDNAGRCEECNVDDADVEPYFLVQVLHGKLVHALSSKPDMDPLLWKRLPQEVMERVLAMVPPAATFRFSAVCKTWLTLFSSPAFKKFCFEVAKSGYGAGKVETDAEESGYGEGKSRFDAEDPGHGAGKSSQVSGKSVFNAKDSSQGAERSGEGAGKSELGAKESGHGSGKAVLRKGRTSHGAGKYGFDSEGSGCRAGKSGHSKGRSGHSAGKPAHVTGKSIHGTGKSGSDAEESGLGISGSDAEESGCGAGKSGHGEGVSSHVVGIPGIDGEESAYEWKSGYTEASDVICALEYQPGRLCPGCQPRPSDISYFGEENKVYKIGLSFLPEKFQLFLLPDCVVQDGFVCLFKAESFAMSNNTGGSDKMKRLSFCVANPFTRSWKELPPEVCTYNEYKQWRDDWTVRLEVQDDKFTVCLLTPREKDGGLRMTVNRYSSDTGTWRLTYLQNMRYIPPMDALEGEGKWPCYTICKGFLCTGNYRQARLETMVHNVETGELVYFQDDLGSASSSEDDFGDNPPLRVPESNAPRLSYERGMDLPFKLASNCNGFFCAARFFSPGHYQPIPDQKISAHEVEEHIRKAIELYLKRRRRAGYAIWKLDLSTGVWKKISKSPMPQQIKQKLMRRPPWNPFKVYRGRGPKDVRILYVDGAVMTGDTIYLNLGIKEDYNFLVSDPDLRLWTGMVAYHIPDDSWKLIYHGLVPHLHGNEWHVFRPSFTDFCLC